MGNDIVLVRHAHTAQSGPDAKTWPLSERGRTEAARLARWPGWQDVAAIVTSAEAKAIETAAAITAAHPHLVTLPAMEALGEVDRRGTYRGGLRGRGRRFFRPAGCLATRMGVRHRCPCADRHCDPGSGHTLPCGIRRGCRHGLALTLYLSTLIGGPPADIAHWRTIPFAAVARVARTAKRNIYLLCSAS